ncbi:iron-containing alcohol dehydrogenase [Rossellomorea aquimaris]|uniref:iron-containing alcohol dehydrogenase n=1 Tax=Rossellomorea aquimaris TaxID=189382 RepID=UPI001CD5563B|nr:iron-containing alcohol dehydrogenase [Rossellomorea aquimaris]MCA1055702.1 iron-containing alcohol dehydrogenase [Rossellomorea aquimaris]
MEEFASFRVPQTVLYGRDAFVNVGKEAASRGKKVLIVSDKVMDRLGYVKKCRRYLLEQGVGSAVYLGVDSEPTDRYVEESLQLLKDEGCEAVISLGGGSCIDTAKAIVVLAANGGSIGEYMGGISVVEKKPLPHIAIPTTAGTGSEATDVTVITDTAKDVKMMIKHPAFMPVVAIVDPFLSVSSPGTVTAATGVDALSHAVEAYLSKKSHPMTDTLALSAIQLIADNLLDAYRDGEDLDAREAMSLAAMQAGMAFSNASVCLVHGMSRPIGALFHVPHGFSNAMLLPAVLEFSKDHCTDRLAEVGRIFQKENSHLSEKECAEVAVEAVKKLCSDLNIPNLKGWGIDEEAFSHAVSKMTDDAFISGSPANNPRVPTRSELEELYHICYDYQFSTSEIVK